MYKLKIIEQSSNEVKPVSFDDFIEDSVLEQLVEQGVYTDVEGPTAGKEVYLNGELLTKERLTALITKEELDEYAKLRQYPEIGDQLDDLFKAGAFSTEMTAQIQAVKDANPKP